MARVEAFPRWLEVLLSEKFYNACVIHEEAKKNEKNIFCVDCALSLCPHCLPPHRSHRLLQIRRYVYHDVIRLDDATKLLDCAFVQSYTTNSAKVVFLNPRPQTRTFRGSGNFCCTCDRSLQDPYLFCSLSCKIEYLVRTEGGVANYLYECKFLSLPEPEAESAPEASGSGSGESDSVAVRCTAATAEIVRKKRSSVSAVCRPVYRPVSGISVAAAAAMMMNRRKGNPQRAPLY